MGLFKKTESLNDRIKSLRKGCGLTQLELAEKLNITDKAVSKWESGDGNPDISLLPALADIFNVTVDYLLTGRKEETISIDDMDSEKREMLFIKNDDAVNFAKYGYVNPNIVLCSGHVYGRTSRTHESEVLNQVFAHNSKKIFSLLLKASLGQKEEIIRSTHNSCFNLASSVRCNLDDYIKMCCSIGSVEGLEFIGLKYFVVGDKTNLEKVYFHIRESGCPTAQEYSTCTISKETLAYALNPKTSDEGIIDYLCKIDFYKENANQVYFMTDDVLLVLYENGDFKRINNILKDLNEYNDYAGTIFNESLRGSWYLSKGVRDGAIYFSNQGSYLRAYVYPINKCIKKALDKNDYEWFEKFNDYNKKLNELIPDLKLHIYSNKEIEIIKVENNPKTTIVDLLELKNLTNSFFKLSDVLNCACLDLEGCKIRLKEITDINEHFIKKYYISPFEMMLDCLKNKNLKALFKFATDIEFRELQDAILNNDTEQIKTIFVDMFIPSKVIMDRYDASFNEVKNIVCISGVGINEVETEKARKKQLDKLHINVTDQFLQQKQAIVGKKVNNNFYAYLKIQLANIPLSHIYDDLSIEAISKVKEDYVQKCVKYYEDLIEEYTHQKALEKEYEKITKELSKEYLISEINRGESDKAVVLICKRLQIILQYKYKYEGDLFEMIDKYMNDRLKYHKMINPYDDEDNNYYNDLETDRLNTEDNNRIKRTRDLLHMLRMKRNNIVHAEMKTVDMSKEEILECIDLIELISK